MTNDFPERPEVSGAPIALMRLARGIQSGILGGCAMLALLILASVLRNRVWWEIPNVLGSTFFGSRAFRSGIGMATLAGAALHFVVTGSLGGLFGLIFGKIRERKRSVLLGVLVGLTWYYVGRISFWSRVNPWFPVYSPAPIAMLANALFGFCLGFIAQKRVDTERAPEARMPLADAVE